jgi:monoamine oxidase
LFDQALTETLFDYIDFQQASKSPWFRVEGGMSEVTKAMAAQVQSTTWPKVKRESPPVKISLSTPVVAMGISADRSSIDVSTTDAAGNALPTQQYDMVFSTTAMGPLQRMDLAGLELPDEVITGIRALSYDRATKVAIKFKTRWWKGFYRSPDRWGGVSQSDLPISNVVYPSWDDGEDSPAVLIVSYTWAQDATRMASLVPDYSKSAPQRSDPIVALCLRDLVKLWAGQPNAPTFEKLWDDYAAHHAWAWSHDPYTGGAFALFSPGQFGHLYPRFLRNFCKNKFAMSGEALSAHHAWISGALDSAYGSVMRWLLGKKMLREAWHLFMFSPFGGGKGKHAAEFDDEILRWGADLSKF